MPPQISQPGATTPPQARHPFGEFQLPLQPVLGMKVETASARAQQAQRIVVELLCADRPEAPHRADSKLDHWERELGVQGSRFPRTAQAPASDRSHPAITVKLDACIHCTRCVRACREVQVNDVIGFAYRGAHSKIVFDLDDAMGASSCVACGECVRACPYKKSMYNPYTRVSEKCVRCYPAVEKGYQPMCVQNCIGKIRIMGLINPPAKARPDNPIDYLVHVKQLALPYYPQLGLEPNIYYLPPIHAHREYLGQMFGPNVEDTIARYQKIKDDPVAQGLMVMMGSTDRIIHRFKVDKGIAYGFDEADQELVRVPIKEPLFDRPAWDESAGLIRNNTP